MSDFLMNKSNNGYHFLSALDCLNLLTEDQKKDLGNDAEDTLEFIRGKDPESGKNRVNIMGDVVHSSPVFFDDVVYFGANDGMLHAHLAKDGTELFAYVPYLVFDHLKDLADPDYGHKFYVDSTPSVQKGMNLLYPGGEQTLLVSGLGAGGKGYFALDVSRPDSTNFCSSHFRSINLPRSSCVRMAISQNENICLFRCEKASGCSPKKNRPYPYSSL